MKSCRLCWLISLVLVVALGAMAYVLFLRGDVAQSKDGRTAIMLNGGERDLVLEEMRGFLEGVQEIITAASENDMKTVAASAKVIGMANAGGVPLTLMSKLPIEFKTLGLDTHKGFDDLAREAEDLGDAKVVISKLGDLLNNCTSCHSTYRLGNVAVAGE